MARERAQSPLNVHLVLVLVTAGLIIVGVAGHLLRPDDELFLYLVTTGIGALFGKLTNGFGRRPAELLGAKAKGDTSEGDTSDGEDGG